VKDEWQDLGQEYDDAELTPADQAVLFELKQRHDSLLVVETESPDQGLQFQNKGVKLELIVDTLGKTRPPSRHADLIVRWWNEEEEEECRTESLAVVTHLPGNHGIAIDPAIAIDIQTCRRSAEVSGHD